MRSTLNLPLSLSHTAAWARAEGICPPTHPQLRGLQPVPDDEVIDLYGGTQHIPLYQMSGFYGKVPTTCCCPKQPGPGVLMWVLASWEAVVSRSHSLPAPQGRSLGL